MPPTPSLSRILVTGAGGFLGRHLVEILGRDFLVRALDIQNYGNAQDFVQASVTDREAVYSALEGVDGVVIAHMLPNKPGNYDSLEAPIEVNVKGASILLQEAVRRGIKRVVLISSTAIVQGHLEQGRFLSRDLPACPKTYYGLTKTMQEASAKYFHEQHHLEVAVMRPAYVVLGDNMQDKYGIRRPSVNWQAIDPRDIASATCSALSLDALGFEIFYLVAGPDADEKADIAHTKARLGWKPAYCFEQFPRD